MMTNFDQSPPAGCFHDTAQCGRAGTRFAVAASAGTRATTGDAAFIAAKGAGVWGRRPFQQ